MEITEEQLRSKLIRNATVGGLVKNWCKHPAFKLFEEAIQTILDDKKEMWLKGTDEEARNARAEARGVAKAMKVLQMFKASGELSKKTLMETYDLDSPNN